MREKYVVDSDSLINFMEHEPRLVRVSLRDAVRKGDVFIPDRVVAELLRHTDGLSAQIDQWKRRWPQQVGVQLRDPHALRLYAHIQNTYTADFPYGRRRVRGLGKSPAGTRSADPQVIALAKFQGFTAVTNDNSMLIVCLIEGVPTISWAEFARRIGPLSGPPLLFP